jgi:hypothetical protein
VRLSPLRALLELAARQHRARPLRSIATAAGVAVATLVVSGILGGGLITGDLSQRDNLAALPEASRAFQVTMLGTAPGGELAAADRTARSALAPLSPAPPVRSVVLRETNLAGRGAVLAAVDGIDRWVALTEGRLPRGCTGARCEVVQVAGPPASPAPVPGATLVVVGAGKATNPLPFGRDRLRSDTPLFVASDTAALSRLPGVDFVYRSTTWTAPLEPDRLHSWQVPKLLDDTAAAARSIESVGTSDLQLTGPTREILAARTAGRAATQRLGLLGAAGVALVLAFAALAASMLRGDHDADRERLTRRGATRRQLAVFAFVDRAWISLVGTVAGAAAGVGLIAAIAGATHRPVGGVLRHSLLSGRAVALVAGLWLVSTLVLMVAGSGPAEGIRVGALRLTDVVVIAAIGAAVLSASRGSASAAELASGSFDPLLVALPIVACLIAGAVALRLTGPLVRWCERRFADTAPLALRLALVAQARRPRRVAMSAAFVVVAVGLAIFATGYAATLAQGQRDQATFAVPLDASIEAGPDLVSPLDVADLEQFQTVGRSAVPILRTPASITGVRSQPIDVTLLGVPADLVETFPRWRHDTSATSRADLATAIRGEAWKPLSGVQIPADATALELQTNRVGAPMDMLLVVRRGLGSAQQIALGTVPKGEGSVSAAVPAHLRGAKILAIRLGLSAAQQINSGHAEAEGRGADVLTGSLGLGTVTATTPSGPVALTGFDEWVGRGAALSVITADGPHWSYKLAAGQEAIIRAEHPSDQAPVPVVVSDDIARAAGDGTELTIAAGAGRRIRGRIVAAANRFPTIRSGGFAIADQTQLAAALDAVDPGAGSAREVWVSRKPGQSADALAAALATAPFKDLQVRTRADELDRRRSDSRARGVLWTLGGLAAAALLLGIVALGLATATDIRDERVELADLDAQGLARDTLTTHLRLRGVVPLTVGLLGGLALGVGLVALVVRMVLVTAGSDAPVPSLVRVADWPRVSVLLAAFSVVAAVTVAGIATRALRAIGNHGAAR